MLFITNTGLPLNIFACRFDFCTRFLDGMADAAAWTSIISILICLFPHNVASVLSWTEMLTGLGYMLGILYIAIFDSNIRNLNKTLKCCC